MLQDCFDVAISILGIDRVGGGIISDTTPSHAAAFDNISDSSRVECKRPAEDLRTSNVKRQKTNGEEIASDFDRKRDEGFCQLNLEINEKYASDMGTSLLSVVESLRPIVGTKCIRNERALETLSMLCMVFCKCPSTNISVRLFQLMYMWIPWICRQVMKCDGVRSCLTKLFAHPNVLIPESDTLFLPCRQIKRTPSSLICQAIWKHCTKYSYCQVRKDMIYLNGNLIT